MTQQCKGIFGRLFGHKIVTVMDKTSTPLTPGFKVSPNQITLPFDSYDLCMLAEANTKHETKFAVAYCKRCGQKIEKPIL